MTPGSDPLGQPEGAPLPQGVEVFEAPHALLIHAALSYLNALIAAGQPPRVLILRLARVRWLDRRAALTIANLARLCRERHGQLLLSDLAPANRRILAQEGILDDLGPANVLPDFAGAVARARVFLPES